eukprot:TRINITY_DN5350_c0_g1_i1.p1 TRINITY_DN5350_c0_g1~~TRINITY_DN5350_c0_g1_i1.p1  ORF type:complete len:311 (-),score=102.29 TRINITY_DN5350_c0_g1_i1:25-957(-)
MSTKQTLLRYVKELPKNGRAKKIAKDREPKIYENVKRAMFIKGHNSSQILNDLMKDLNQLKKPDVVKLSKKNKILPFEDETQLEFLSRKNDSSLFMLGNHTKKRPHNLTIGRLYDYHVLDLIELGIENYKGVKEFESKNHPKEGMKPCFVFCGPEWENNEKYSPLRSLFIDFFRGKPSELINLDGLEHVIICTVVNEVIHFRHYSILLKKSGSILPRVELEEIGPSFDMKIRRTKFASEDLLKETIKLPPTITPKPIKNIEKNTFGETIGRIHVQKEDISQIGLKKPKRKRIPKENENDSSTKKSKETQN